MAAHVKTFMPILLGSHEQGAWRRPSGGLYVQHLLMVTRQVCRETTR